MLRAMISMLGSAPAAEVEHRFMKPSTSRTAPSTSGSSPPSKPAEKPAEKPVRSSDF